MSQTKKLVDSVSVNTIPNPTSLADEISLRDVFLVLKRWWWLTLSLPILLAISAFLIGSALPKVYSSRGLLSLTTLKTEPTQTPDTIDLERRSLFANLPLPNALAQGFEDSLNENRINAENQPNMRTEFDEIRNLLVFKVDASSGTLASQKVEQGLKGAQAYFRKQITEAILVNATATIAQTQQALSVSQQTLVQLGRPNSSKNTNNSSAALESNGIDPQIARSSNPGAAYIGLEEAKLQTEIARGNAKITALEKLKSNPQRLNTVVDLYLRAQVLASPSQNENQTEPKPVLYTVIALILGLFIGIILPFALESAQKPKSITSNQTHPQI